jgi:hypothetical protein
MVRRCADWFVKAGASWFVVVCYGYVRQGSSRQAGLGADRCVLVGCGELRQVRHGAASSRKVRLVPVRQVRRDKVGHGEVRQV